MLTNRFLKSLFPSACLIFSVLFINPSNISGHGMHGMHAMQGSAGINCPVCQMSTVEFGYDNKNYVVLTHGQKIFTCGMDPRTFDEYPDKKLTDTAYLGANMAEFIVNDNECENSCPICQGNEPVLDPITGDKVTTANFKYICLHEGQKIYFASDSSRSEYLKGVKEKPRYLVEEMKCFEEDCKDGKDIEVLSQAATKMVEFTDHHDNNDEGSTTATSTSDEHDHDHSAETSKADSSEFCVGAGSVMFNGFQFSINGPCVLLFFSSFALNSWFKYIIGFLVCFGLSLGNEYLVKYREITRQNLIKQQHPIANVKAHKRKAKALLAFMYMIQMSVAYLAMLVVMTYEIGLFLALILGFGAGYILLKDFEMKDEEAPWRYTDASTIRIPVIGMKCRENCGSTVEAALRSVKGVDNAFADVNSCCVFVSGSANYEDLVSAIEGVGFSTTNSKMSDHNV